MVERDDSRETKGNLMLVTGRVVAWICVVLAAWPCAENVSSKYEYVDVDLLLSNHRTVSSYINCILDKGPCTPEGRDLKGELQTAQSTKDVCIFTVEMRVKFRKQKKKSVEASKLKFSCEIKCLCFYITVVRSVKLCYSQENWIKG
jgi:hypothetical protein